MNRLQSVVVATIAVFLANVCVAQDCHPSSDGSVCEPLACSDIPEEQCIPGVIHLDVNTGALTVDDCACTNFNVCHIRFGDASPFAEGYCPNGPPCRVVSEDTNNDGQADTFYATCRPECCDSALEPGTGTTPFCNEGATCCADGSWRCNNADGSPTCEPGEVCPSICCLDIDDGPVPYDTCANLTRLQCEAEGGHFGGSNTTCEETEACCLSVTPNGGADLCVDLHRSCCVASGGTPKGVGTSCGDTNVCPQMCGGIAGIPCEDPSQYCRTEPGECCCDFLGVCAPIPGECPPESDQVPVCGCDGVSYENVCEAAMAGVSIEHYGSCELFCLTDSDCSATTQFCQFPVGTCGGTAGEAGICRERPQGCPDVWEPVCGCNGVTYSNECDAAAAGVSIRHKGECFPIGACCLDFTDGPIPFDTCLNLSRDACVDEGGIFGDSNATCEMREACCLNSTNADACVELHPFCCVLSGGVPQGPGSSCYPVHVPESCGGWNGAVCPEGYQCVDDPNDNCEGGPAVDCPGKCVPMQLFCEADSDCPLGFRCVDPDNGCLGGPVGCPWVCVPIVPVCGEICGGFAGIPCHDPNEFCKLPIGACCCDQYGVCTPIPNACPDVWEPVCGCDGVTYGNRCEADAAGMSIDHVGPCGVFCITDADCDASAQYCRFGDGTCGTASVPGECMDRPQQCPLYFDPVCGCDGATYGNRCEAEMAGVSIRHEGPCEMLCGANSDCPADNQFCKFPPGNCGTANAPGVCTVRPEGCPENYDPVCGCDGVTYVNECEADAAGVSIQHHGECGSNCLSDSECSAANEYCMFPEGSCGGTGTLGECTEVPDACFDLWDPVCGCDGVTYGNECEAAMARVSIRHRGECERVCGGLGPYPPCENSGEFCKYPVGVCNDPNALGICSDIPDVCTEQYDPVCGCDDVTYANECFADMAGVSIRHPGECVPGPCFATRFFEPNATPSWYCPGHRLRVHIALSPPDSTTSLALEDTPPAGWAVEEISDDGVFDAVNGKVKWGPFFPPFPNAVSYVIVPTDTSDAVSCFVGTISIDGTNEPICGQECMGQHCPSYMPADSPQAGCPNCPVGSCTMCDDGCSNGVMSLCELVGYACSWKNGCNDDLAGVTRAAYIWRNGECYCWDDGSQSWLSSTCPPPDDGLCSNSDGGPASSSDLGRVVGRLASERSRTIDKRQTRQVEIRIEAPEGTLASGLEIEVPLGWKASDISDGGDWDGKRRKVKWGPFTDKVSRRVSVVLERTFDMNRKDVSLDARTNRALRELRGTVSFDGVNRPISIR